MTDYCLWYKLILHYERSFVLLSMDWPAIVDKLWIHLYTKTALYCELMYICSESSNLVKIKFTLVQHLCNRPCIYVFMSPNWHFLYSGILVIWHCNLDSTKTQCQYDVTCLLGWCLWCQPNPEEVEEFDKLQCPMYEALNVSDVLLQKLQLLFKY